MCWVVLLVRNDVKLRAEKAHIRNESRRHSCRSACGEKPWLPRISEKIEVGTSFFEEQLFLNTLRNKSQITRVPAFLSLHRQYARQGVGTAQKTLRL